MIIGVDAGTSVVKAVAFADNGDVLREAACKGLGIALLPTVIAGDAIKSGRLAVVLDAYSPPPLPIHADFEDLKIGDKPLEAQVFEEIPAAGITMFKDGLIGHFADDRGGCEFLLAYFVVAGVVGQLVYTDPNPFIFILCKKDVPLVVAFE